MQVDLRPQDVETGEDLVKLGADEELDLEGRVVEVHGVPAGTTLPGTIQGTDDKSELPQV